jgi:hypothetical protein
MSVYVVGRIDSDGYPILTAERDLIAQGLNEQYPGWMFLDTTICITGNRYGGVFALRSTAVNAAGDSVMELGLLINRGIEEGYTDTVLVRDTYEVKVICHGFGCVSGCHPTPAEQNGEIVMLCAPCIYPPTQDPPGHCDTERKTIPDSEPGIWSPLIKIVKVIKNLFL